MRVPFFLWLHKIFSIVSSYKKKTTSTIQYIDKIPSEETIFKFTLIDRCYFKHISLSYFTFLLTFFTINSKDNNEDIISKKSLDVVKDVIILLKQHSREEGLFRRSGRRILREHILEALRRGERLQISNTPDAAKECAAALQLYLAQMKTPVMPERVQQLLLADNPGITAHTIAHDALGLIRQDVVGRHSELLVDLLGLLKHLLIFPPPSERTELQAPSWVNNFLPVFFNFETDDETKRREVATRLNELIIEAPELLMRKKRPTVTNSIAVVGNESNNLARIRDLPLFTPLMRFVENRNSYHLGEAARAFARPIRRQAVGRLHPAIVRARS